MKDPKGFRTWVVQKLQHDDRIRGRGPSLCPLYRMTHEESVKWYKRERKVRKGHLANLSSRKPWVSVIE